MLVWKALLTCEFIQLSSYEQVNLRNRKHNEKYSITKTICGCSHNSAWEREKKTFLKQWAGFVWGNGQSTYFLETFPRISRLTGKYQISLHLWETSVDEFSVYYHPANWCLCLARSTRASMRKCWCVWECYASIVINEMVWELLCKEPHAIGARDMWFSSSGCQVVARAVTSELRVTVYCSWWLQVLVGGGRGDKWFCVRCLQKRFTKILNQCFPKDTIIFHPQKKLYNV